MSLSFADLAVFLPPILWGALTTVFLAAGAFVIGGVGGLLLALARLSKNPAPRLAATGLIWLILAVPVLIQLLWLYYLLPMATGIILPDGLVLVLTLSLTQCAVMAENYRTGLRTVPAGQREGAIMLGLNGWQRLRYVVLPQAVRAVLPLMASTSIVLVKDSAIATFIGYDDILNSAREIAISTYRPIAVFTLAALVYFALTYPISLLSTFLERKAVLLRPAGAKAGAAQP
jgi:polar amino acid transport system permease protein